MICERKHGRVDRASVKTRLLKAVNFQPRQNPHGAPATGGLFEQDLSLTNHKSVFFDESRCTRARFADRQRFRTFCTAELFHRANATFGLSGNANKRAEIDECGVVNPGIGFRNKTRCVFPERCPARRRFDRSAKIEKSCQNTSSVSFDDWD